jgi:putative ABC transport system permease protein
MPKARAAFTHASVQAHRLHCSAAVMQDSSEERAWRLWWHEVVSAFVGLWRSPRHAVPALLSLGLGVGAATAVFSLFSALMLRPLPFPREQELVRAGVAGFGGPGTEQANLSPAFAADFRELSSVFDSLALHHSWGARLTGFGEPRRIALELTSLDFFDTLQVPAIEGRTSTSRGPAPDGLDVVVLRQGYWKEALGGQPVVGTRVLVDNEPKTVLGIVADEQALPNYADMWTPRVFPSEGPRFFFSFGSVGRIADGTSFELAQKRFTELTAARQIRGRTDTIMTGTLTPLREVLVGAQRGSLGLMLAAVVVFLLLACANVAALLGTRASVGQRDRAVRSALGASRWALLRQNALEALMLAAGGGLLGLGLALAFMQLANEEYRDVLANTPARLDAHVVVGFAGLLAVVALVAAWAPTWHFRRVSPMDALRGEGRSSQSLRARRVRESLVVIQVATTLALLVNAGLLVRSVQALLAVDPGFRVDNVVAAALQASTVPGDGPESFEAQRADAERLARRIHGRLAQLPGVTHATVAGDLPFDWFAGMQMMEPEPASGRGPQPVNPHFVSPGYFATLGIGLISGRDFGADDPREPPTAIVNRSFARQLLGVEDAVGHTFRFGVPPDQRGRAPEPPWIQIVGMSEDTLEVDLVSAAQPAIYLPLFARPLGLRTPNSVGFAVAVQAPAHVEAVAAALPGAIRELSPDAAVFIVEELAERVRQSFWERTALLRVLSAFALAAVLLAAIGLFGVTGYAVAERAPEIGIRRALGADRGAIQSMILRETAVLVTLGMALGVLMSWLGRRALETFLFGVSPTDPLTYLLVCAGILVVALLAALLPARAAAAISPVRALAGR